MRPALSITGSARIWLHAVRIVNSISNLSIRETIHLLNSSRDRFRLNNGQTHSKAAEMTWLCIHGTWTVPIVHSIWRTACALHYLPRFWPDVLTKTSTRSPIASFGREMDLKRSISASWQRARRGWWDWSTSLGTGTTHCCRTILFV